MTPHRAEGPGAPRRHCASSSPSQLGGETLQGATNIFLRRRNEMEKILFTKIQEAEEGRLA